jgi:hypothetical protein
VSAERLTGFVARWRNLAESRGQDGRQHPTGRAEHLKRVAGGREKREKENNSEKLDGVAGDRPLADSDNSQASRDQLCDL